jgi:hypothetical protein
VKAAVVLGLAWGTSLWLAFGIASHALNLLAFVLAVGVGLLFFGPVMVIFIRHKQSRER